MKKLIWFLLLLLLLSSCAIPPAQDLLETQTSIPQREFTVTHPTISLSPTLKLPQAPTNTVTPTFEVIDTQNIDKLTLLHTWEADEVSILGDSIPWALNGNEFLLPIRRNSVWGIQLYNADNFTEEWFVEAEPGMITINSNDDVFTYSLSLEVIRNNGQERISIADDNCPDRRADYIVNVPNSNLLISGIIVGEEWQDKGTFSYLQEWDVNQERCLGTFQKFAGWLFSLDASSDGKYLSYSAARMINDVYQEDTWLYDLEFRSIMCDLAGSQSKFSRSGELLVYERINNQITRYDPSNCELLGEFNIDIDLSNFAINPDGNVIVGGNDSIALWDVQSGLKLKTIDAIGENINWPSLGFSPDGRFLVTTTSRSSPIEKEKIMLWGISEN